MLSLLVIIFLIELAVQAINTIGAATINSMLWTILTAFPTQLSRDFTEQRKLQQDFLKCRRDLNATSSQDEFAKWAKLRRHHDKLLDQLEKKKAALDASRASFDRYLTVTRLVLTRGLQYFLPFWYSKEPMFWLPHGWFPYYAEWILSFPKAPMGSVSIASWQVACSGVMALVSDTIVAVIGLLQGSGQGQPMPMKAAAAAAAAGEKSVPKTTTTRAESKKDT